MTEIYLHIVARMADYMATHPYRFRLVTAASSQRLCLHLARVRGHDTLVGSRASHHPAQAKGSATILFLRQNFPYYCFSFARRTHTDSSSRTARGGGGGDGGATGE